MLKKIKKLFLIFIGSIFLMCGIPKVFAAPESVTSQSSSGWLNITIPGVDDVSINISRKKAISSGDNREYLAYCVDQSHDYVASVQCSKQENYDASISSKVATAISYFGDSPSDEEYFATQLAIWYILGDCSTDGNTRVTTCSRNEDTKTTYTNIRLNFDDSKNSTYKTKTATFAKYIVDIIKYVESKGDVASIVPSIKINSQNVTFQENGDYYVTNPISVDVAYVSKYTLELKDAPTETLIVNEAGVSKTEFSKDEKFIVKVPTSSMKNIQQLSFNVKLTAESDKVYKSYKYDCANNGQDISLIDYVTTNLLDEITLSLNNNIVKISKADAVTGKELPGATLELYDKNGKLIEKWVSTKTQHVIGGLEPGEYTLKETIAPEGYELSEETIKFTVKEDGTVDGNIVMKNEPEPKQVDTGDALIIIAWVVALSAIGYVIYYFLTRRKSKIKK